MDHDKIMQILEQTWKYMYGNYEMDSMDELFIDTKVGFDFLVMVNEVSQELGQDNPLEDELEEAQERANRRQKKQKKAEDRNIKTTQKNAMTNHAIV